MSRKRRPIQQALEECLAALERGEGLEACLARYPQQAAELRPLLEMALSLREAGREPVTAPPGAVQRFLQRAEALRRGRPRLRPWRVAALAASLFLALSLLGGATVFAASRSLPDSPLYPIKLTTERVRLWLAPNDVARAGVLLDRAEARLKEVERLAAEGKPIRPPLLAALERHTERAAALLRGRRLPRLQARAETIWARQGEVLARLLERATPEERAGMVRAFLAAHRGRLQLRGRPLPPMMRPPLRMAILRLQGPFHRRGPGVWSVGGAEVVIGEETIIDGRGPREGQWGVVVGVRLPDGRLKALAIFGEEGPLR